ncbi:MAG: hypothetical protein J6J62_08730, partial [Oscillospiraceae bacterium]|nr:hypothetical protein [Oscillospiraceae bacterium]
MMEISLFFMLFTLKSMFGNIIVSAAAGFSRTFSASGVIVVGLLRALTAAGDGVVIAWCTLAARRFIVAWRALAAGHFIVTRCALATGCFVITGRTLAAGRFVVARRALAAGCFVIAWCILTARGGCGGVLITAHGRGLMPLNDNHGAQRHSHNNGCNNADFFHCLYKLRLSRFLFYALLLG